MSDQEKHSWQCDCVWCWVGLTNSPPPPPRKSWLKRFRPTPESEIARLGGVA